MAQATRYEIAYFPVPALGDLPRMLLDVAGVPYENKFLNYVGDWPVLKDSMAFGRVPRLTIYYEDGTKKELFESFVIEAYLAETLSLLPGIDAFSRAECLSVASSLKDMDDKIRAADDLPTIEARRDAQKKNIEQFIPSFLRYHERLAASRGGPYYFGDKLTVADLKLYAVHLRFAEMYGSKNPVTAGQYPTLAKLVQTLDAGRAGDYARNRRLGGNHQWNEEEQKWVVCIKRV